jgi:hypothetical protein
MRHKAVITLIGCVLMSPGGATAARGEERYDVKLQPDASVAIKDVTYTSHAQQWFMQNDKLVINRTISFEATYTAERDSSGNVILATWKVSKCVLHTAGDKNEKQLVAPGGVVERRVEEFPVRKSEEFLVEGKPADKALAEPLHSVVGTGEAGGYARAGAGGSHAVGEEWPMDSAVIGAEFSRNPKGLLMALPQDIKASAKLLAALPVDGVPSLAVLTDSHIAKLTGRPGVLPPGVQLTDGVAWQKNLFIVPADGKAAGVRAEVTDGSLAFGLSNHSTRRMRVHLARVVYPAGGADGSSKFLAEAPEKIGFSFENKRAARNLPGTYTFAVAGGKNATTTTTKLMLDKDGTCQRQTTGTPGTNESGRWSFDDEGILTLTGPQTVKLPLLFCDEDGLLLGKAETTTDGSCGALPDECFYRREIQKK